MDMNIKIQMNVGAKLLLRLTSLVLIYFINVILMYAEGHVEEHTFSGLYYISCEELPL